MKYVTDLSTVKPENILHINGDEVVAIYPRVDELFPWFVVRKNSDGNHWGDRYCVGNSMFFYKPKTVKCLKPLHQILSENAYCFNSQGTVFFDEFNDCITPVELQLFRGTMFSYGWPDNFYHEVEEGV